MSINKGTSKIPKPITTCAKHKSIDLCPEPKIWRGRPKYKRSPHLKGTKAKK